VNPADRPSHCFSLTVKWWVLWKNRDPVRAALRQARAEHLAIAIGKQLAANKDRNVGPQTFKDISDLLGIDTANFWRWRAGETQPDVPDMHALAETLGVQIGELFPPRGEDLSRAVHILSMPARVKPPEPSTYAAYILIPDRCENGTLDPRAVREVANQRPGLGMTVDLVTRHINAVVNSLEPKLKTVAQEAG
jgi:transcriptional regulator with XRE-family HTH domain